MTSRARRSSTKRAAATRTRRASRATRTRAARSRRSKRKKGDQLGLSARGTWGGYRDGAGRKRIPRHRRSYVPHITRPKVTKSTPVHVTLRLVDGLPSLRRRTHQAIIERIFARENRKGFRVIHYSIQGNHLHLIAEGDDTKALSRGVQRIASRMARLLNDRWNRRGRLVKERFHGQVIRTPKQMRHALRYVLLNKHKHEWQSEALLSEGIDPYSSGDFFDGWVSRNRHRPPNDRGDPVVPPTCWLLTKGWRRHGKLAMSWR